MANTWREWLSNAAKRLPQQPRRNSSPQQGADNSDDEGNYVYNRVSQHSDDEDERGLSHPTAPQDAATSSAQTAAGASPAAAAAELHGAPVSLHHTSHSDGDFLGIGPTHTAAATSSASSGQALPSTSMSTYPSDGLLALDESLAHTGATSSAAAAMGRLSLQERAHSLPGEEPDGLGGAGRGEAGGSAGGQQGEASTSGADEGEGHEYSEERRELYIYAVPLTKGKFIFLPVTPWREQPESHTGIRGAIGKHVDKAQGEASDMWNKLGNADRESIANKIYKFGRRVLESVPAEERLMRGIPKQISKVIIYHPTSFPPDAIQEQMQTMTKSYGIKAVGRAAAATVMLPLALGVDLIILPGPQVLTYYTLWELWRSTNGAVGTQRMAKFVTQGGTHTDIRVNYATEPKLDRFVELASESPEGVLSEEDIEALVADLREASLLEPLLELRNQSLRRLGVAKGEYSRLPGTEPAGPLHGSGGSGGGAAPRERWSWGGGPS